MTTSNRLSLQRMHRPALSFCFLLSILFNLYLLLQLSRHSSSQEDQDQIPIEVNFLPILNSTQAKILEETLRVFDEAMRKTNISYLLIDGSVIGAYRHHGRIPWDGDIDVMVNNNDEKLVEQTLTDYHPDYGLYVYVTAGLWKFYWRLGSPIAGYPHTYPFLDIFFYFETKSHIVRTTPFIPRARYRKDHVFPLKPRPFGDLIVPVPCDPVGFLEDIGIDVRNCLTDNKYGRTIEVACNKLVNTFPFVQRSQDSFELEKLVVGGRTLRTFRLQPGSRCSGEIS